MSDSLFPKNLNVLRNEERVAQALYNLAPNPLQSYILTHQTQPPVYTAQQMSFWGIPHAGLSS